jgi:hypothetical protein
MSKSRPLRRRRELRCLRERLAVVKAENDRVFFQALDSAPPQVCAKGRLRWALDVLKVGDEYTEEKEIRRQIGVLEGRYRPNSDGSYVVVVPWKETQNDSAGT